MSQSLGNKKNKKSVQAETELTKDEMKVVRFLRLNCPSRQGSLMGMKVNFFISSKILDCLVESKWGPEGSNSMFSSRQACVIFMQRLMNKQMFYRAVKIYKESPVSNDSSKEDNTPNLRKRKAPKDAAVIDPQASVTPSSSPQQQRETQNKRKFKLEMHEDQKFLDATGEPYVWVYDPTTTKTYIIGALLILGAIGVCLFPLWPSTLREGVYYLSLAGASFLGAILGLAVFKYILFGFVWVITFGRVHFWLFPNLTEDVGFFESFVPVYKFTLPRSNPEIVNDLSANETSTSKSTADQFIGPQTSQPEMTKSAITKNSPKSPKLKKMSASTIPNLTGTSSASNHENDDEGFEILDDEDLIKASDAAAEAN